MMASQLSLLGQMSVQVAHQDVSFYVDAEQSYAQLVQYAAVAVVYVFCLFLRCWTECSHGI